MGGVSCKGNKELDHEPSERSGMHLKDIKQRNDVVRFVLKVIKVFEYLFCALTAVWRRNRKQGNWLGGYSNTPCKSDASLN